LPFLNSEGGQEIRLPDLPINKGPVEKKKQLLILRKM